jgi:glycosyltransferase involved in cell wall biosynthesis
MELEDPPAIVGIALLRNEDLFVERAIRNTVDFCDLLIVADHGSTDGTLAILQRLAAEYADKIKLVRIQDPRESHFLVSGYANSRTWGFAVDGDEIYDPAGLAQLRRELLAGKYDATWHVFGNVLNCVAVDAVTGQATGYLAPPCRSMTKLFNLNAIESWDGAVTHVFANGTIKFKAGYDASLRLNLHETYSWEEATFRCLHVCFMQRSSLDGARAVARPNVSESLRSGPVLWLRKLYHRLTGRPMPSDWKREKYARGPQTTVDATAFFPPRAPEASGKATPSAGQTLS